MKIIIVIMCLLLMVACDPGGFRFDYSTLKNEVIKIELVKYNIQKQVTFSMWAFDQTEYLLNYEYKNEEKLEELDSDSIDDFLNELKDYDVLLSYFVYNTPKGLCIKMSYSNGDFEIINCDSEPPSFCGYIGRYSANGKVVSYTGCFSSYGYFANLVNNYFETKIPSIEEAYPENIPQSADGEI